MTQLDARCWPNRRDFLTASAMAGLTAITPQWSFANRAAANDRINVGIIGIGMQGRWHLGRMLGSSETQVVAIAEVEKTRREEAVARVEKHYADAKKSGTYRGCQQTTDFREILARDDVDAVVIATPDHWHAIPCLMAARAGKDIYCEKPLTLTLREGRMIADAVAENKVIFQTGSQQRSEFGGIFRRAVEFLWDRRIGRIESVRVGVGAPPRACDLEEKATPDDVDWQMWVGPSAYRGYNEVLCPKGMHRHFPAFRQYKEYAGGSLADMGAHHFDIAQWALGMDRSGPVKVEPPDAPDNSGLKFTYADGTVMYHGGPSGCTFTGTDGTLYVDRGKMEASDPEILKTPLAENARRVYPSNNHHANWIDCIRKRKEAICPAEIGHRSASICQLANIGYELRRILQWDPAKEEFVDDTEANALRHRAPRGDWSYEASV